MWISKYLLDIRTVTSSGKHFKHSQHTENCVFPPRKSSIPPPDIVSLASSWPSLPCVYFPFLPDSLLKEIRFHFIWLWKCAFNDVYSPARLSSRMIFHAQVERTRRRSNKNDDNILWVSSGLDEQYNKHWRIETWQLNLQLRVSFFRRHNKLTTCDVDWKIKRVR